MGERARYGWASVALSIALFGASCGNASHGQVAGAGTAGENTGSGGGSGVGGRVGSGSGGGANAAGDTSAAGGASAGQASDGNGGKTGNAGSGSGDVGGASSGGIASGGGGQSTIGLGGSGGEASCVESKTTATLVLPALEFLVDTSLSMMQAAPNTTLTKYEITRDALAQAFAELKDGTGVGLIFYPNVQGNTMPCIAKQEAVPMGVLDAMLRQALVKALQAKQPLGSTPTHDALSYAYERLAAAPIAGDKYVVLLTDGAPTYSLNCGGDGTAIVDSSPLLAEAENAVLGAGIRTFVVGSPGSEDAREVLSRMAQAGRTAPAGCSHAGPNYCHFDMTTASDLALALTSTLDTIAASAESCRYALPLPPGAGPLDRNRLNVVMTPSTGAQVVLPMSSAGGACTNGWRYSTNSASVTEIVLCESTCAAVKADPKASVEFVLGCATLTQ